MRRHKAAANEIAAMKLGQPLRILDVGLASLDILDMSRIGDGQGTGILKDIEDGFPKDPGTFHRDVGAAFVLQPIGEGEKTGEDGREFANLFGGFGV